MMMTINLETKCVSRHVLVDNFQLLINSNYSSLIIIDIYPIHTSLAHGHLLIENT